MRALLTGMAAAAAIIPTPAFAVDADQTALVGRPDVTIHSGFGFGDDRRRHGRRDRDGDGDVFIGEWPQQGDTAWRSDSFNDWWHDRPDRAYPRWMLSNQNCDRMWWGGGAWRC